MPASRPLEVRFWEKVHKTDGCWIWTGAKISGYGSFNKGIKYGGRIDRAHRVSWEIHNGPIPKGMDILHQCDNPPCVRPDHLFLGTQLDNTRDCENKGRARHPKGLEHGMAKLTDADVLEIRRVYNMKTNHGGHLGRKYNVTRQLITKIVRREVWKHI